MNLVQVISMLPLPIGFIGAIVSPLRSDIGAAMLTSSMILFLIFNVMLRCDNCGKSRYVHLGEKRLFGLSNEYGRLFVESTCSRCGKVF